MRSGNGKPGLYLLSSAALAASWFIAGTVIAQSPSPIPDEVATALKNRVGKWHEVGSGLLDGKQQKITGTEDCKSFAGGVGVICTWHDSASNSGKRQWLQILGYDTDLKKVRFSSVYNDGHSTSDVGDFSPSGGAFHGEFKADGKPGVYDDTIKVAADANSATEHLSVDVGGKRIVDLNITHSRVVATAPSSAPQK